MKPDDIILWGIQVNGKRGAWLWGEAYRTQKEARAAFLENWSTPRDGLKRLADKTYQIVKLDVRVAE